MGAQRHAMRGCSHVGGRGLQPNAVGQICRAPGRRDKSALPCHCLYAFGGRSREILHDRMKAAVTGEGAAYNRTLIANRTIVHLERGSVG